MELLSFDYRIIFDCAIGWMIGQFIIKCLSFIVKAHKSHNGKHD